MNKIEELKKMLPSIQNSVSDLRKESANSLCGPCPKCGGDDRFVYRTDSKRFFCRQCNEKGGDVIDFHAWIEGTDTKGLIKKYLPEDKAFVHYQLGEPVEKYSYTDAKGKVLYWNCRFEPKTFRQCSADGLSWTVKDIKLKVPYNLPEVLKAKTVFILNGEKACNRMNDIGQVGACNVAGEGNWTSDLNEYFRGKEIFLLPDNDDKGRKHVAKVYENLKDIAASIKIIELSGLPKKGDFVDWLETFHGDLETAIERFSIMVEGSEPYVPQDIETESIRFEFIHNSEILTNLKPVQWRVDGIMENNSFYYNFGDAGHFKTFVEIDRLLHIATGMSYHGHKVEQGTVFYIAGEGQQGIGRRLAAWHIHHKTNAKDVPFFVAKTPTQLMDKGATEEVKQAVDYMVSQYGPPAIIHIDTLARNFGEGDENSTKDMNRVIHNIDAVFGNSIGRGLTHHTGHTNKERARGAYALHGAADSAYRIEYRQNKTVLVTCKKMKDAPFAPAMLFKPVEILLQIGEQHDSSYILELDSEGDEIPGMADNKMKKIDAVVTALMEIGGQVDSQTPLKNAVQVELDCGEATARRHIKYAVEKGKIIEVQSNKKGVPNSYQLPL